MDAIPIGKTACRSQHDRFHFGERSRRAHQQQVCVRRAPQDRTQHSAATFIHAPVEQGLETIAPAATLTARKFQSQRAEDQDDPRSAFAQKG